MANPPKNPGIIEHVAHAPIIYLSLFFLGGLVHFFYPRDVLADGVSVAFGILFLALGPLLILWSQASIRRFRSAAQTVTADTFKQGPYRYTRNPTYLGLTFLIAGFGLLANAAFIVLAAAASFILVNFTLLRGEERLLEDKYGEHYREYKKAVRRWF